MGKAGRPPLAIDDPSVTLHVRVPATQFDAVCAAARAERLELAEWVRGALHDKGASAKGRRGPADDHE